jgi:hypothetical protein
MDKKRNTLDIPLPFRSMHILIWLERVLPFYLALPHNILGRPARQSSLPSILVPLYCLPFLASTLLFLPYIWFLLELACPIIFHVIWLHFSISLVALLSFLGHWLLSFSALSVCQSAMINLSVASNSLCQPIIPLCAGKMLSSAWNLSQDSFYIWILELSDELCLGLFCMIIIIVVQFSSYWQIHNYKSLLNS